MTRQETRLLLLNSGGEGDTLDEKCDSKKGIL
ncbi:hypothetical protein HBHAL_4460 [Halobacillus halophilus DSM 2266]|uniref:Uncharacterized protein n=1 Tax=Halobacillus halophilus (strain ATCC 35676 / DSM 2266 / JCM 20832 / KCTC 3685 / LMG 17431 / NBRC 102448 / NCIMB 2269) TaxID=866895 RepID=I0JRM9_HALH3|nr:hypothetical protein HBHAL_4460 [Halobacillus halophilus DSM 2266]